MWVEFEAAFREKFIPREYIQQAMDKYLAIKQTGTVSEYIVERETLENTLGNSIPQPLKESSFRKGLENDMRRKMQLFRELPFEEFKTKAESIDNDMKDTKTGPQLRSQIGTPFLRHLNNCQVEEAQRSNLKCNSSSCSIAFQQLIEEINYFPRTEKAPRSLLPVWRKGHLIKDCPKPAKTCKASEINVVGVVFSDVDTIDLKSLPFSIPLTFELPSHRRLQKDGIQVKPKLFISLSVEEDPTLLLTVSLSARYQFQRHSFSICRAPSIIPPILLNQSKKEKPYVFVFTPSNCIFFHELVID